MDLRNHDRVVIFFWSIPSWTLIRWSGPIGPFRRELERRRITRTGMETMVRRPLSQMVRDMPMWINGRPVHDQAFLFSKNHRVPLRTEGAKDGNQKSDQWGH